MYFIFIKCKINSILFFTSHLWLCLYASAEFLHTIFSDKCKHNEISKWYSMYWIFSRYDKWGYLIFSRRLHPEKHIFGSSQKKSIVCHNPYYLIKNITSFFLKLQNNIFPLKWKICFCSTLRRTSGVLKSQ